MAALRAVIILFGVLSLTVLHVADGHLDPRPPLAARRAHLRHRSHQFVTKSVIGDQRGPKASHEGAHPRAPRWTPNQHWVRSASGKQADREVAPPIHEAHHGPARVEPARQAARPPQKATQPPPRAARATQPRVHWSPNQHWVRGQAQDAHHAHGKTASWSEEWLRRQHLARHPRFLSGKKKQAMDEVEKLVVNAMKGSSDDDAFDAFDAITQLSLQRGKSMQLPVPDLMDSINTMRCNFCFNRPDLLNHDKCMKFLTQTCKEGAVCEEVCNKFRDLLKQKCNAHADPKHKYYCEVYQRMTGEEIHEEPGGEDSDGDGVPNHEDAFPNDPKESRDSDGDGYGDNADAFPNDKTEWGDMDGDGIGDNKDKDIDGDGHDNALDVFPHDPHEWSDLDKDGIGDNSDKDRDGDGHDNEQDAYPEDPTRWKKEGQDSDGDGVPDNEDAFPNDPKESKDSDGDGHGDNSDAFPQDAKEWGDLDGDGIGDNSDPDRDGDGHNNEKDAFPNDKTRWEQESGGDVGGPDRDGDGHPNNEDAFPDHAEEYMDSDSDGIGDNQDAYPMNPDCWRNDMPCDTASEAVAKTPLDPFSLDKVDPPEGLPKQGYDEHSRSGNVKHQNTQTFTGDWSKEWPIGDESEEETITRICEEHPENTWCHSYYVHGQFAR